CTRSGHGQPPAASAAAASESGSRPKLGAGDITTCTCSLPLLSTLTLTESSFCHCATDRLVPVDRNGIHTPGTNCSKFTPMFGFSVELSGTRTTSGEGQRPALLRSACDCNWATSACRAAGVSASSVAEDASS